MLINGDGRWGAKLNVIPMIKKTYVISALFLIASSQVSSTSAQVLKWEIFWGTSGFDVAADIAVDNRGSIYITGVTRGGPFGNDAFVASFDSSGALKEQWFWGTSGFDEADGVAVDADGNIYIAGYTNPGPLGGNDAFVASFDSSGVLRWESFWGTSNSDRAYGIAVDSEDNVYIAGTTGEDTLGWDAFVASFDRSGALRWQTLWNARPFDHAYDVAVDIDGNVYITGGTAQTASGPFDAFTVAYDRYGVFRWQAIWPGSAICDWANGVAVDVHGNVYIVGLRSWGPFGEDDMFIVSYDSTGVFRWETYWGTSSFDAAKNVALDTSGNIYIAGYTSVSPSPQTNVNASVASFDSSGVLKWQVLWNAQSIDVANGVAVDVNGNVYIAGYTAPSLDGEYRAFLVGVSQESVPPEPPPPSIPEFPLGPEIIMILAPMIATAYIWWRGKSKRLVGVSDSVSKIDRAFILRD